jgi:serine/threonine protein kinase
VKTHLRTTIMEDLTGQYFGGYKLEERIGTGGMASIYKAFDESLSRWVALKVMPIQAQVTGEARETVLARFRQEAQAIARLRHQNILTIYGYGEEEGWAYIVMEYLPGGSLQDRLKSNGPFEWKRALQVVMPVAQALAFGHQQGIIHRDIKPANILMAEEDWPLLADFGLAKILHSTRMVLTGPGQVVGTMAYAAPEQVQGDKVDARVDIYSLGIVLYELLTGQLPFRGVTQFDFMIARLTDRPIALLEANPDAPALLAPIIDKALAPNPNDRYQTMTELYRDLMAVRYELSGVRLATLNGPLTGEKIPALATKTKEKLNKANVRLKLISAGQDILRSGRTELVIGRTHKDSIPDIDLGPYGGSQAGVSRRHNRLLRQGDGWFVEDLGSTNGTFVNGVRVAPQQMMAVKNGDVIRCGQIELKFGLE